MPIKRNLRKNKRSNRKSKHMQRRLSRKQIGGGPNGFEFILYSNFKDKGPYGSARNYQVDAFYTLRNSERDDFIDYFIPRLDGQPEIRFRLERTDNSDVYKLKRPDHTVGYLRGSNYSAGYINRLVEF